MDDKTFLKRNSCSIPFIFGDITDESFKKAESVKKNSYHGIT